MLTHTGDLLKGIFPAHDDEIYGYQGVLLGDVLHNWPVDSCKLICKNVYNALPPNGYIFVHEMLFDADFSGPLAVALMSSCVLRMTGGQQFSFGQLKSLLNEVGFGEICQIRYASHYSLVVGKKIVTQHQHLQQQPHPLPVALARIQKPRYLPIPKSEPLFSFAMPPLNM